MIMLWIAAGIAAYCAVSHFISYTVLKNRVLKKRRWDLNICCGHTDGGGLNVDIIRHKAVPNFHQVTDIYHLPFNDGQFNSVLCSHTIEHVDDPASFYRELRRVGKEVTLVIPPLYDISAALNFFEHRYLFLSFKKVHRRLPKYVRLPFSRMVQRHLGQNIEASAIPLATVFTGWRRRRKKKR